MPNLVFLIDVDNTLINNDAVKQELSESIQVELGEKLSDLFWEIYEEIRKESGVVNIPLSLRRLREEISLEELDEQTFEHVRSLFDNYPFFKALYPHTIETLQQLRRLGLTVIVSDGDQFFQAEKIVQSTLAEVVDGRVLLYIHKQQHFDEITSLYPADHYAIIDDKPQILIDSKALLGHRLTTVFVQQGKYAEQRPADFSPDIAVKQIGDLRFLTGEQFLSGSI